MDFRMVLERLLAAFEAARIRYALMGGFALGLWGVHRATVDLDLLVMLEDMDSVHEIMASLDYERVYHSENVSQYISPLAIFGEVDFLHAFRQASLAMLRRARDKTIFSGAHTIKVLEPEDIIGLKLQAIANNPSRKPTDLADIEALADLHGRTFDWERIEEYSALFGLTGIVADLRRKALGDG